MNSRFPPSDSFCFIIRDLKFLLSQSLLKQFFDGTLTSFAICDQSQKATMIISFDKNTKIIHLQPLIRQIKEFEIQYDDLMNMPSASCIPLPTTSGEISQNNDLPSTHQLNVTIIEPEERRVPMELFVPRKFLSDATRKKLSEKFGADKTDDQLVFINKIRDEELRKIILLEQKLGIEDPGHSRSLEQLEDMMLKKKGFMAQLGEFAVERMKFKEFEELYFYYLKLSERYSGNENRVMYKLTKLVEHRKENEKKFGRKNLEELDELLRNEDLSQ